MPVFRSTRNGWIMGFSSSHVRIIEEATSQEQLIKAGSEETLKGSEYPGIYHSLASVSLPPDAKVKVNDSSLEPKVKDECSLNDEKVKVGDAPSDDEVKTVDDLSLDEVVKAVESHVVLKVKVKMLPPDQKVDEKTLPDEEKTPLYHAHQQQRHKRNYHHPHRHHQYQQQQQQQQLPGDGQRDSFESCYFEMTELGGKKCSSMVSLRFTRRVFKNLFVLGSSFMLLFTAFTSLQSLQSTLNAHRAVGLTSLSCVYGATVFSCFFAPAVIGRVTTKWTIVLGYAVYLLYFGSNFYPRPYVMIPMSIVLGLVTGPMWSAQSTYLTTLALRYAQVSQQFRDSTLAIFNGVFCGLLQTSQIWGNLLSAGVLSADNDTVHLNQVNLSHGVHVCGARDCGPRDSFPDNSVPHFVARVPPFTRYMLLGSHVVCAAAAILLTVAFLDRNQVSESEEKASGSLSLSSQQLFLATVRILQDSRLVALSPLVLYTGLEQGFVLGDFTKSFVNCTLGIHNIGHVMVCFGLVNAVASVSIGHVAKHVKRFPIMVAGTLFNVGLMMALLWWRPTNDDLPMFYVISACLGLCDAIWQTQTNTLFGVLFSENQEAAFACYRMFQAGGFAVAFGYSYFLCVRTKVYVMSGVLVVALVFYSAVEFKLQQRKRLRQGIVVL